jgi:hypothetical protein
VDFEKLGQIDYKASNATKQDYFLYDNAPLHSQNYYKLQELDMQGNLRDLGIRSVNLGLAKSEMLLYPNPSAGPFYLVMGENVGDKLDVALLDAQGKLVARERILVQKGNEKYPVIKDVKLSKGMYVLKVQNGSTITSFKLLVP